MRRPWVLPGALSAAIAVAAGAFGAHALKARLAAESLATWDTAARYQLVHAVALVVLGALAGRARAAPPDPSAAALRAAGWLFVAGSVLFCGSLYLLVLTGERMLGAVAPLGGGALIAGWLCVAWAALRER